MTGAKPNKNSKAHGVDERISTHPSYKEYSWDTLTASKAVPDPISHKNGIGQQMNSTAAVRGNTGTIDRVSPQSTHTGEFAAQRTAGTASAAKTKRKTQTAVKVKAERAVKVKTKVEYLTTEAPTSSRYSFPLSLVLMAVCATALIMAIITTGVQINEITAANADLKSQQGELEELENELARQLEVRDDLRVVEKMAKDELGMVKKDQVDRYYLSVHKEDKIEIIEEKEEVKTSFFQNAKSFGESIVERVRGFFGM